ncbi:MAG: OmpW family protein [Alphaproteobacteria bacterium]|nr:MAG: OmpW family protein [Alphaproteobacteria bacterium]
MISVRKVATAACAVALLAGATPVMAKEAGDLLVRARAIVVEPDESADITVIGGDASIDTSVMPELDFTYFFTDNIAAELILAVTPHDVTAVDTTLGDVPVGDTTLLPPTLTLQYHFMPRQQMSPYVGVGVNYTHFFDVDAAGGTVTDLDLDDSFGLVLQAGIDFALGDRWVVNADVKKVWINTDASLNGGAIEADVDIDPWIFGLGVGYRF